MGIFQELSRESGWLAGGKRRALLLVEKDRKVRSLFTSLGETEGPSIIQAERRDEACATLRENADRIGVVFTDIGVPAFGGQELLRLLKAATPSVTPLYTSGRSDGVTRQEALAAGANDFIP